jgi:hypothetical protein
MGAPLPPATPSPASPALDPTRNDWGRGIWLVAFDWFAIEIGIADRSARCPSPSCSSVAADFFGRGPRVGASVESGLFDEGFGGDVWRGL